MHTHDSSISDVNTHKQNIQTRCHITKQTSTLYTRRVDHTEGIIYMPSSHVRTHPLGLPAHTLKQQLDRCPARTKQQMARHKQPLLLARTSEGRSTPDQRQLNPSRAEQRQQL